MKWNYLEKSGLIPNLPPENSYAGQELELQGSIIIAENRDNSTSRNGRSRGRRTAEKLSDLGPRILCIKPLL
jgi:hypothetical protein